MNDTTIHLFLIPSAGSFLAHPHDERSYEFLETAHRAEWHLEGHAVMYEDQYVFPMERMETMKSLAEEDGITVEIEGSES